MKVLVTGATGHVGANLVRRLLADGKDEIRVLLHEGRDQSGVDGLDVERAYGDVRDLESVRKAVKGCDRVYHVAAMISIVTGGEREIYDTNVLGTRNILTAAKESSVARTVVTSSFSAVGQTPGRASNENDAFYPFQEHMPYEISKAWMEQECLKAVADGLDVVIATSCAVIGPNDFFPSRMGRVLCDVANRKMRAYIPGGFDFVAARDIVEGHVLAMEKGRTGQKYIISTRFTTVDELMDIYERVTGQPKPPLRLTPGMMMPIAHTTQFVLKNFFPDVPQRFTPFAVRILSMGRRADTSKAQRELGYRPSSVEQAIEEAYAWFHARGKITHPAARKPEIRSAAPSTSKSNGAPSAAVGAAS